MNDPLKPDMTLLIKLGSLIVHQDEYMSSNGHHFDKVAMDALKREARHVDKLRIMRGQCCNYIGKLLEICDGINR